MATLSSRNYLVECSMVSSLSIKLPPSRRAGRTIAGYESMNMIRKGQIQNVERGDILSQIKFIHSLFGIAV